MNNSLVRRSAHSIELTSSLDELSRVRGFCREVIMTFPLTQGADDTISKLQLAVVEATTNVIRHAYDSQEGKPIRFQATLEDGILTFDILHEGKHFEPNSVPQINEPLEGGMGLFLIEQCVDRVSYLQTPDGWRCIRLNINF